MHVDWHPRRNPKCPASSQLPPAAADTPLAVSEPSKEQPNVTLCTVALVSTHTLPSPCPSHPHQAASGETQDANSIWIPLPYIQQSMPHMVRDVAFRWPKQCLEGWDACTWSFFSSFVFKVMPIPQLRKWHDWLSWLTSSLILWAAGLHDAANSVSNPVCRMSRMIQDNQKGFMEQLGEGLEEIGPLKEGQKHWGFLALRKMLRGEKMSLCWWLLQRGKESFVLHVCRG